jgi:hypothetical protein
MAELRRRDSTWGFVNVALLKGNLCGEGDGTSKHLNATSWKRFVRGGKFSEERRHTLFVLNIPSMMDSCTKQQHGNVGSEMKVTESGVVEFSTNL